MSSPRLIPLGVCLATILLAPPVLAQSSSGTTGSSGASRTTPSASSTQRSSTAGRAARGPLPDPALLDGSTQEAEKKSEYGMLGEFEIPGDENAKGGKVGGQKSPPGAQGGSADPSLTVSLPGMPPMGMPSGAAGGTPSTSLPDPTKQSSGAAGGSGAPETGAKPSGSGNAAGPQTSGSDAGAGGIQVAELKTDPSAGPGGADGPPDVSVQKPKPVGIGDPTMAIKPAANAPGVVGAQTTAGNTQQMEKAVGGSAGKGSSGDNSNRGVEKGRAMPAGL